MRKLTRRDAVLGMSAAALTMARRESIAATPDFSWLPSNALASAMWRANCRRLHSIDSSTTAARRLRYASYFLIQSMARSPVFGRMPLRFPIGR